MPLQRLQRNRSGHFAVWTRDSRRLPRYTSVRLAPVRQAVLILSVVAFAASLCIHLHAGDKTAKSQTSVSKALPPLLDSGGKQRGTASPIWCPDDYCPKCPPCVCPPTYCGGCDCYVAKCLPRICPPRYCGGCDCYDAKCAPCVKIPWCFPSFYKCPPPECCGKPAVKSGGRK